MILLRESRKIIFIISISATAVALTFGGWPFCVRNLRIASLLFQRDAPQDVVLINALAHISSGHCREFLLRKKMSAANWPIPPCSITWLKNSAFNEGINALHRKAVFLTLRPTFASWLAQLSPSLSVCWWITPVYRGTWDMPIWPIKTSDNLLVICIEN
jgi:hypothetical protein